MKIQSSLFLPMVALAILLDLPNRGSAQILLTADNFAILSGSGSVTNVGNSIVTGEVGSSTSVSGFPPGTIIVNGSPTTPITGGSTLQAELDLIRAENGLASMVSTATKTGVDLGGLTLLPGVYTFASAASQNGILTLNANNQQNPVWVFQIGTSLTTSVNSAVILENAPSSGSNAGIYWDANSAITIGAGSTILGNYLAGTSITFAGNNNGMGGRLLAQAGVSISSASILNSKGDPGSDGYDNGLMYNGNQVVPKAAIAIPEPAAFFWLAPLGALGVALWRRRTMMNPLVTA